MVRDYARLGFLAVAWLFVACCVVQVFLAGLGVFQDAGAFITHRDFGYAFGLLTIVLIVLALVGRLPRRFAGLSALMLVLFALQSVFVLFRTSAPEVAALHPLNGFLILLVAVFVAWRALEYRPGREAAMAADAARSAPPAPGAG